MTIFASFFSGVMMATFAASGLFFLKFWRASRDVFFLLFGWACFLLAAERVFLTLNLSWENSDTLPDAKVAIYLIRLLAFILILMAIIQRNRSMRG